MPGGATGIGFGCACALAEAGAEVVIRQVAQSNQLLMKLCACYKKKAIKPLAYVMDISDIAGTKALLKTGPFDIVLNCAGIARHKPALTQLKMKYASVRYQFKRGLFSDGQCCKTIAH